MGKTTVAKTFAHSLSLSFQRIQFTPDLLPTNITGLSTFRQETGDFEFRPGPVFANIVLSDEISRASPKTQSALLEAMEELQVSVDGQTDLLPQPFMVLATQNPIEQEGTVALPEAQLDRFLVRLSWGYLSYDREIDLVDRALRGVSPDDVQSVATPADVMALQDERRCVHVEESVRAYAVRVVRATRDHPRVALRASPRAIIGLVRMGQALAVIDGRDYVTPDVGSWCGGCTGRVPVPIDFPGLGGLRLHAEDEAIVSCGVPRRSPSTPRGL